MKKEKIVNYIDVGLRISKLFSQSNLSQVQLAAILDVKQPQIARYTNGDSLTPDSIARIASHFNVSSDWLLFGDDHQGLTKENSMQLNVTEEDGALLSDDVRDAFEKAMSGDYSKINKIPKSVLVFEINNLLQKTQHIRGINKELTETINNYEHVLRNLKQK